MAKPVRRCAKYTLLPKCFCVLSCPCASVSRQGHEDLKKCRCMHNHARITTRNYTRTKNYSNDWLYHCISVYPALTAALVHAVRAHSFRASTICASDMYLYNGCASLKGVKSPRRGSYLKKKNDDLKRPMLVTGPQLRYL